MRSLAVLIGAVTTAATAQRQRRTDRHGRALTRARLLAVAALAALVLPGQAAAHGRAPTVALDYRLRLAADANALPGVRVRVLDGDRSLQLSVAEGRRVVVEGYLREPLLRIDSHGVWVNAASPTAAADRLVSARGKGWIRIDDGRTVAWHDHRLSPPPASRPGPVGRFAIPISVDGREAVIAGTFWRIGRPSPWPWLAGAAALVAAVVAAVVLRPGRRAQLTVGLGVAAGIGALAAVTTFAARDAPNGRVAWVQIGAGIAIAVVLGGLLGVLEGRRRVHAAGIVGGIAAAACLASLPVFWHGVVISALPPAGARLACGLALVGGIAAAALSFLPDFDDATVRR
jgi:hypothetical protein